MLVIYELLIVLVRFPTAARKISFKIFAEETIHTGKEPHYNLYNKHNKGPNCDTSLNAFN